MSYWTHKCLQPDGSPSKPIVPIHRVLVEVIEPEEESTVNPGEKSRIIRLDDVVDREKIGGMFGRIIEMGTTAWGNLTFKDPNCTRDTMIGSIAYFGRYSGEALMIDGKHCRVMNDDSILLTFPPDTIVKKGLVKENADTNS